MYYKTKTPGSLMIMGEHSVLHGYPSIVASVDQYVHVTVSKGTLGRVRIESDYFGSYETDIATFFYHPSPRRSVVGEDDGRVRFDIILAIMARYGEFLGEGIDIQVKSDFSPELGLGSSGALIVGLVSALMMMFERKVSKEELLLESLGILKSVRKFASGSDLAASIYRGVVYFNPKTCTAEKMADSLPIIFEYSGYKTKTDEVIEKIHKEFEGRESELERIYEENGKLTDLAALAIRNKDDRTLGQLMNQSNKLVYESLNLVTDELQNILEKFMKKDFVYGSKVSGAGLGDCAIALAPVNKSAVARMVLGKKINARPIKESATAFAPSNIAICKYWGKRDEELHLPVNSSLSISLDDFGSRATISLSIEDKVKLNGTLLEAGSSFVSRIFNFIDLFRQNSELKFFVDIDSNIPIAAGLASSAAGFAALTLALNDLFGLELAVKDLSILARLGSGSAARSIENGFVQWHKGIRNDGMDSYAGKLPVTWPSLCIGILTVDKQAKQISSREAMKISKETSPIFESWIEQAGLDMALLMAAIKSRNFIQFGTIVEQNSNLMHETMASSNPRIIYGGSETKKLIAQIKSCRETIGLPVFYTQDAGPNLVIFFEEKNQDRIRAVFSDALLISRSFADEICV
jgi:diphosphomevalonate decarboxylase